MSPLSSLATFPRARVVGLQPLRILLLDATLLGIVFTLAATVTLGRDHWLDPLHMLTVLFVLLSTLYICGVYGAEVRNHCVALFRRSLLAYMLSASMLMILLRSADSIYGDNRFLFFFLFISFFVFNTVRSLLAGSRNDRWVRQ